MQLSEVIPPRLRPQWHYPQGLSRWHFGAAQATQLVGLAVVAVVMIPISLLVLRAAGAGQEGIDYLLRPRTLLIVGNSISLMLAATGMATAIAVPFAWLTARCDLPGRRLWLALGLAAMVIPSYLVAVTYSEAFGPRGIVQGLLEPFGVQRLPGIKGFVGATLTLGVVSFPYIALPLRSAILQCDRSLEEAGYSLGLGPWGVFRQITAPQLRPALSAGILLAALYILSDFGAVAVMQYNAFTRAIFLQTESFRMDKASLLALVLIVMALALLVMQSRMAGRGLHFRIGSGASRRLEVVRLGKWRYLALAFCGGVVLAGVVIPIVVLFSWLVGRQMTNPVHIPLTLLAGNTIGVSAVAAIVVTVAALPLALLAMRRAKPANRWLVNIAYAGNVLPGIVVALALVSFASQNLLSLYQTLPLLILGYAVRYLPLSIGATESAFAQINPRFEEAGRSLGLGRLAVLARITVPLARGGILAGMALVFLNVMKELPTTLILRPIGFRTFATRIWSAYDEAFLSTIALPGLALIVASAFVLLIVLRQEDILD
ncbi:MAG: iron ABC transporter permease [Chloroflexi bacterium]|nr:iron ABC transporter permease [Chloroflexota bacterium]